jgi:hypothetical protein
MAVVTRPLRGFRVPRDEDVRAGTRQGAGARPGEPLAVPFPEPRTFDVVTTPTFESIKERVLHLIREELTSAVCRGAALGRTRE